MLSESNSTLGIRTSELVFEAPLAGALRLASSEGVLQQTLHNDTSYRGKSARLLVGLQALDRVVKIGVAVPAAFGARGEHERKSELARRCHGGGDALGRLADVE